MAVLSAFGLSASVYCYLGSYSGLAMEALPNWALSLHVGAILLILPTIAIEHPFRKDLRLFWGRFGQRMPKWVVPAVQLLGVFFFIHFIIFLVQSHAASPGIRDGEYVLESHGRLVRVITQTEYLKLKGGELRLFSTGWIFFYFVSTAYWWFPRNSRPLAES